MRNRFRAVSTCLVLLGLASSSFAAETDQPPAPLQWGAGLKILVVGGGSSHDFKKWFDTADVAILNSMGSVSVNYTESSAVTAKELPKVDVLVSSTNQKGFDTPDLREALMKFADSGKGIVLLHPGVWYNWNAWPEYNKLLVGGGARGHTGLGEFEVKVLKDHPVTKGVAASFKVTDELYWSTPDPSGAAIEVLAQTSPAPGKNKEYPSVWLVSHPQARIVCIALGHDGRVHDLPEYKTLLTNSVNWVARK
jgi:type 1 glutamine amidotransferase